MYRQRVCVNSTWGVSWHATAIPSIKKRIEEKGKLVFRVEFIDIRAKFVFFLLLSIPVPASIRDTPLYADAFYS